MIKDRVEDRIAMARSRLSANLSELQQRVNQAKAMMSPSTYLSSPWLKVGAGVALGLLLGRRRVPMRLPAGDYVAPPSMGQSVMRAALNTAVTSLVGVALEKVVAQLARKEEAE